MKLNKLANVILLSTVGLGVGSAQAASTKFGDTTVTIGGFIKANAMWTDYEDGGPLAGLSEEMLVPSTIPVGNPDVSEGYQFDSHIKTSRIGFKTSTPTNNGTVITNLEYDLLSTASGGATQGNERISNSATERVRHAYLQWNYEKGSSVLVGQTWSTFFNVGALPESVDFIGPTSGTLFNRQWQVRWTKKMGDGSLMLSAENPSTSLNDPAAVIGGTNNNIDDNKMPDLVARYNGKLGDVSYSAAAIVREIAYDTGAIDDSKTAVGVSFSGKIALGGKDDIKFMLSHGTLGRYIALNAFNDAAVQADQSIDLTEVTGGFVAYRHWWSDKTRSTFQYATSTADLADGLSGAVTKEVSNFEVSLITSPTKNLDFGAGFIQADRELENGVDGTLTRLQFFGKLKF